MLQYMAQLHAVTVKSETNIVTFISSPGRNPGRAILLPPVLALAAASALAESFNVKVFM